MADNVIIGFMSRSILHTHQFSWVFLVNWIMILFLSVFCLFYFNQLLGFLVTQTVGWYLWHRYGIYFKIQSIQISLIGGRLFFRNAVYIGTSQAVRLVHGNLSWRYWIPKRQKSAFVTHSHPDYVKNSALQLNFYGVEWFIYNREYAYDVLAKQEPAAAELAREFENWQQGLSSFERKLVELLPLHVHLRRLGIVIGNDDTESLVILSAPDSEFLLDMAAPSTKYDRYMTCMHASFHSPIAELRSNPDYNFSSITPESQAHRKTQHKTHSWVRRLRKKARKEPDRPWLGLSRYMDNTDEPKRANRATSNPLNPEKDSDSSHSNPKGADSTMDKTSKTKSSETENSSTTEPGLQAQDYKTEKYPEESLGHRIDNNNANNNFPSGSPSEGEFRSRLAALPTEYAKVSQLFACDLLKLSLHIDVVGKAEDKVAVASDQNSEEAKDQGQNPLFDIEIEMNNAKISYGPYAERQRQSFYSVFFPRNCSTASPPQRTAGGTPCYNGLRMHPEATINIQLLGETALVIPVRESSKDEEFASMFLKSLENFEGEIQRTFGWLEVHASEGSYIELSVPFLPDDTGFHTNCTIELRRPDVRSSVNHDTMLCATHHSFKSVQYQPLAWNGLQTYTFENHSTDVDLYILREHITLINDMTSDFGSGVSTPYALFTPAKYVLDLEISNFSLFLNVNKGNIINKPTNLSENTFLIFRTPTLNATWDMPRDQITSPTTILTTVLDAPVVDLELSAPNWHTLHGFLDSQRMARIDNFHVLLQHHNTTLNLSQRDSEAHFDTNPSRFVDTQIVEVSGDQFAMTAHGFLIDYLIRVRENYFGHAYHFQTTEEFLEKHQDSGSDEKVEFIRGDVDNDTQVRVRFQKGCFLLPQRLYSCRDCIVLQFVELSSDIRFTNYYMDLQLDVSPLVGRLIRGLNSGTVHEEALKASFTNADLSITQVLVHAHRMFGLPPVEPTYVVSWDFDIGDITTDFSLDFVASIGSALMAFAHSFSDDENKPVLQPEEINDVVFVTMNVASIEAVVRPVEAVSMVNSKASKNSERFQLLTSKIKFRFNDLANRRYSAHRTLEIPFIGIKGYSSSDLLVLDGQTAIYATWYVNKPNSQQFYEKQQTHIALHDALFHRAPFLLDLHRRRYQKSVLQTQLQAAKKPGVLRPCIPITPFDPPMTRENLAHLATQFAAMNERRDSSDSSGHHTSLDSLASDSYNTYSADSFSDSDSDGQASISNLAKARAQSIGEMRDIFPFSGETVSNSREKIRSKSTDFSLNPTQWHSNAPMLNVEDDVENVSCVLQVMPVNISLTPQLFTLVSAFDSESTVDFETQLDSLQINVVRGLVREEEFLEVIRLHVITNAIVIDIGESINNSQGIRLEIKDVDAMLKSAGDAKGANLAFHSLSISLRHGGRDISEVSRINAASLVLSKFLLWWQQTSKEDGTGSLQLEGVDASIAADKIGWVVGYIGLLLSSITQDNAYLQTTQSKPFSKNGHTAPPGSSLTKQEKLKATFYALTMAGKQMGIEQDSYVLSRPSGAVQSESHVRTKTSWRLIMRLRFLLQRLPPGERAKMQNEITKGTFVLPEDAVQQTIEVYRNWRSWEQSKQLEDTDIYKRVFDDKTFQEYMLSLSTRLSLGIDSMVARIVYPDLHDHFAGLDSLYMQLVSTQKNEKQNLNLTFRCSKARARGGIELLTIAATFISAITKLEAQHQQNDNVSKEQGSSAAIHTNATQPNRPSLAHQTLSGPEAFQANISVFLLDLIIEFDLETLHVETQNHQIQFTSSVELVRSNVIESLFHTGTLISSDGAFRIYQPKNIPHDGDVIDSLLQGVQIGYASRGTGQRNNTWVTVKADSLSFISNPTLPRLVSLSIEFLKTDMPVIMSAVENLEKVIADREVMIKIDEDSNIYSSMEQKTSPLEQAIMFSGIYLDEDSQDEAETSRKRKAYRPSGVTSNGLRSGLGGHYVDFSVNSVKLRARFVNDLLFVVQGKELVLKIRHTDAIVSSFDLNKSTIGIHFGDGSAAVANFQLESFRTVLRYDSDRMALAVFNNASAIRLETMSLVWILDYAKHHNINVQMSELVENTKTALDLVQEIRISSSRTSEVSSLSSSKSDPSASTTDKMRLRMVNRVYEISVRLPLDMSPFKLTITGVESRFENFKSFQDLNPSRSAPETFSASIEDLNLQLLAVRKPIREMIRLNFKANAHREGEKLLFNISSDYMRLAMDPEAIGALFIAAEKLKSYSRNNLSRTNESAPENSPTTDESQNSGGNSKGGWKPLSLSDLENIRVKLLLQYLTVTWFTGSDSAVGIVIGFDKLQISAAKLISHIELAGAYATPVSDTKLAIQDRINTAYLPLIDAYIFISRGTDEDKSWIQGEVNGKSVTLSLTPTVAPWVLALLDSVNETSSTLQHLTDVQERDQRASYPSKNLQELPTGTQNKQLQLPFNIRINTHTDRSVLRLLDDNSRSKEVSLELFSPTLDAALEFKDNQLLLRIDASQTSNEIFPKAITNVKTTLAMLALSMKQRYQKKNGSLQTLSHTPSHSQPTSPKYSTQKGSQQVESQSTPSLFENLETDIQIHFGAQKLYLSCLPFGKVGATLATDGVDFLITTPGSHTDSKEEVPYITLYALMKKARISVQHMYSREVSAMVEFSRLITIGMHRMNEPYKIATNMTDLKLNLDLSKLHDMRIFFDIWAMYESSGTVQSQDGTPEPDVAPTNLRRKYSTSSQKKQITFSPTLGSAFSLESSSDEDKSENGISSGMEEDSEIGSEEDALIAKYKQAVDSVPFAFDFNFNMSNLDVKLRMGPAIGDAKLKLDRFWFAIVQSSEFDHMINAGVGSMIADFEGRVGGRIKLEGLMAKMAMQWNGRYPLIHTKLRLSSLGFYFSLDFHPFVVGRTRNFSAVVTTQDRNDVNDDRIHIALTGESVSIVVTALVVVHSYDVISLFKRLQSQISSVPVFMPEVAQGTAERKAGKYAKRKQKVIDYQSSSIHQNGMRVLIDIRLGELLFHAFPTEFVDNMALKIYVHRVEVHYDRKHAKSEFQTGLDFALDECIVGLANIKGGGYKGTLTDIDYVGFLDFIGKSSFGGTIVNTPELTILMDTWENSDEPNTVYYTFSNEVHGSIEVGWNLGSVNFIKEMINTHRNAWAVRQNVRQDIYEASLVNSEDKLGASTAQVYREAAANLERQGSLQSSSPVAVSLESKALSSSPNPNESGGPASGNEKANADNDHDSDNDNDGEPKVMVLKGTRYIAKKSPTILIPQLRDLGDATPPIEWLGINRERIPLLLHQFLIQEIAHGADSTEKLYLEFIGRQH